MVVAGRSHSWTPPAGHLLSHQPERVPKAVKSSPFGSRGMKKVDLGLAASSLRRVGGPALQPSHQHCSLHRPGLRFPCSQTWEGLPCLQPSSPFFGEKEGLEGPTKACVLCTQAVTLPWMAWTQHTHAAGQLHRPRWAQHWLTAPQRGLHTR